jgi:hypothetical protein
VLAKAVYTIKGRRLLNSNTNVPSKPLSVIFPSVLILSLTAVEAGG